MGCHTWFARPVTKEEFMLIKSYAVQDALDCLEDYNESVKDKIITDITKGIETNEPCYYGMTWWQANLGVFNPDLMLGDDSYVFSLRDRRYKDGFWFFVDLAVPMNYINSNYQDYWEFSNSDDLTRIDFPYFHDTFRVNYYNRKILHNTKEVRRYLGKKYYQLTDFQRDRIKKFYELYPGGVIHFG